jgi:alpha-tubulin suppressor-like RCC1 family protein
VTVSGLGSGVARASAGHSYTCAVTTGGALRCWGRNNTGEIGDGTTTDRHTPVAVSELGSGAASVVAGAHHTCAVTTGGALRCWGWNANGQLGDGTTTDRHTPVAVSGLGSGVASVSGGWHHTCAVTTGGALRCWGWSNWGQLGDGTTTQHPTPVQVAGLDSGVAGVSAGDGHTCAVTTGGVLRCWGWNVSGQLGDGTATDRLTPVSVVD